MPHAPSADHTPLKRSRSSRRREPSPIELWRLRRGTNDLRGLALHTSVGYALGLELDTELVLMHLQPTLESLIAYGGRIQTALQAEGWALVKESSIQRSQHAAR
jgi:hypothetical protein